MHVLNATAEFFSLMHALNTCMHFQTPAALGWHGKSSTSCAQRTPTVQWRGTGSSPPPSAPRHLVLHSPVLPRCSPGFRPPPERGKRHMSASGASALGRGLLLEFRCQVGYFHNSRGTTGPNKKMPPSPPLHPLPPFSLLIPPFFPISSGSPPPDPPPHAEP